jgi:hypothetical protein
MLMQSQSTDFRRDRGETYRFGVAVDGDGWIRLGVRGYSARD